MSNLDGREYTDIGQVLRRLENVDTLPVGTIGSVHAAVDALRAAPAPSDHIDTAERISLAMHRWDVAKRRGDTHSESRARELLKSLSVDWHEMPIPERQAYPIGNAEQ